MQNPQTSQAQAVSVTGPVGEVMPSIPAGMTVAYDTSGRPVYVPASLVMELPNSPQAMSPWLRELVVVVVLVLAVVAVVTGAICAVVVICGGTLMGIVGTVSAAAVPVGMSVIGAILAAGWAASKLRAAGIRTGGRK